MKNIDLEEFTKAWLYGYTYREIQKHLKIRPNTAAEIIKKLDLPLRFKSKEWYWCRYCGIHHHRSIVKNVKWKNGYVAYFCPIHGGKLRRKRR